MAKELIDQIKMKPTEWKRAFTSYTYNIELLFRIYNGLKKQRVKIQTNTHSKNGSGT